MLRFVNITEEEFLGSKLLYKHMPLENALRTLKNKSLWFANPATWIDPFEKRFLEAKYTKGGKEKTFNWPGRVFCTCMTQTQSSEAFWNAYSRGEIVIELRIVRENLLEELKKQATKYDIFIGKVEYMKTADIKKIELRDIPFAPPLKVALNSYEFAARLFLLKRIAFQYEDEVRIILLKKNKTQETGIEMEYTCDNTDLIRSIVLDPRLGDNTAEVLSKCFTEDYGFTPYISGKTTVKRVLRSQLYASPAKATLHLD